MNRRQERDITALLRTFGPLPINPTAEPAAPPPERVNRPIAPRRGVHCPGAGWSPVAAPMPVYQAGTDVVGALFPLLAAHGLPAVGARIGYDVLAGSAFHCHPVELVLRGHCTNPNLIVFGEPGVGKSSTVAAVLTRMMLFGTKTLISGDVRGEYTPIVRALGCEPIELGRGSPHRLNALDLGPLAVHWPRWSARQQREELDGIIGRWVTLLAALAEAQGYRPTVTDGKVLADTLRHLLGAAEGMTALRPITVTDIHRALADPPPELIRAARFEQRGEFLTHLRPITDTLANLISGPLAGLFDQPTNFALDFDAPIQSLDLSRLRSRGDQAIAVALTCLGSWSSLVTDLQDDGDVRIVVRDEVWRQIRLGSRALQAIDAELRLSRWEKKIQILVGHKPGDFLSVGAAGSQEVAIARDLLALCSIRVLGGQSTRVATELTDDLDLTEQEHGAITGWAMQRRGRALWKIGAHPGHKVQTLLTTTDLALFDTNTALRTQSVPSSQVADAD